MNLSDVTLVLGIDERHVEELRWSWATWMRFKPEILQMPLVVFYDADRMQLERASFLSVHPNIRWIPWRWANGRNQREKMITGWMHVPALHVETPWYLKLDTDTMATREGPWLEPEWFEPDRAGHHAVFIASKWAYTKPRYAMDPLDDWGDTVPALARHARLNLAYSSDRKMVSHRRIISWFFIGRTEWTREVFALLGPDGRLPLPSQDTFLFYCAARQQRHYLRKRMSHFGWAHVQFDKMKRLAKGLHISPAH